MPGFKEPKDGIRPTPEQQLQLCLLNKRSIRGDFKHNSLLWLPIKVNLKDGKGPQEWWYPVRVQWWTTDFCGSQMTTKSKWKRNIFSLLLPHATKIPLRVPGCSNDLIFKVDSQSSVVKQTIADAYEAGPGINVPIWQQDMGGIGELQDAQSVKKNIKQINEKMAEEASKKVKKRLPKQLDEIRIKQNERLTNALGKIDTDLKSDISDIDGRLSECIADVSGALGHSAEKGYTGPGYEELYLFVHSFLYFGFFAVLFCTMLAFSIYTLMQFFFMFLLLQTEHKQDLVSSIELSRLVFFCYYFWIPYLLIGVSVVGFEVMLLIRSNVRTPQMSRPRALITGFCILILRRLRGLRRCWRDDWQTHEDKPQLLFWSVLKQAVVFVDAWFTVGIDVCMVMGCSIAAAHAIALGYNGYGDKNIPWYLKRAGVCLFVTLLVFELLRRLSKDYAYSTGVCSGSCSSLYRDCISVLEGRMLNWKPWQFLTMFFVMWLGMFLCITNPTVAYEGVVFGGVLWAIFTSSLYMLSDSCLTYKQRALMTMLEMCLDDRAIAPGQMEVRFYEMKNKMQQQLDIGDTDCNAFSLKDAPPSKAPHFAFFLLVLDVVLYIFLQSWLQDHNLDDPMLIGLGLLMLDGWSLTAFVQYEHRSQTEDEKDVRVASTVSAASDRGSQSQMVKMFVNYATLANLVGAHVTWIATFFLSEFFFSNTISFNAVVLLVAVMLLLARRPLLALLVSCFTLLPFLHSLLSQEGAAHRTLYKSLQAAYPALLLIPVMVYWHQVLVRMMPSISHGSANAPIHRRLYNFNAYHALMVFYGLGSVLLFLVGTVIAQAKVQDQDVEDMGMYVKGSGLFREDYHTFSYPVCHMRWGPPELDLGVLDLAILSKYAYADNNDTFKKGIEKSFRDTKTFIDVQVVDDGFDKFSSIPRMVTTKFISKSRSGGDNVTNVTTYVVAFKGTSTPTEAFADGSLYSGVALLGFLSQFIDIFDLVPNTMIAFVLNHLRLRPIRKIEDNCLKKAYKWIRKLRSLDKKSHIVLTGHSLGGGFASALAGITQHDAITFSAPGSHFTRFVFRNTLQRAWRNVVNIWPLSDVVPLVDRHDDMMQRIVCRDPKNGKSPGHTACHLITSTICELWRVCGDRRGRRMTLCTNFSLGYTSYDYPKDTWGKYIVPDNGSIGRSYSEFPE